MGAGCRLWGEDSLQFYYWNRRPFDPNPVWTWNTPRQEKKNKKLSSCNLKFRFFQPGTAVYSHVCVFRAVEGVCILGCILLCEPLTWIRPLTRTNGLDRRESHQMEWGSGTNLTAELIRRSSEETHPSTGTVEVLSHSSSDCTELMLEAVTRFHAKATALQAEDWGCSTCWVVCERSFPCRFQSHGFRRGFAAPRVHSQPSTVF